MSGTQCARNGTNWRMIMQASERASERGDLTLSNSALSFLGFPLRATTFVWLACVLGFMLVPVNHPSFNFFPKTLLSCYGVSLDRLTD
jgi:hypothetical protein